VADRLEGLAAIQRDLDRQEKWADRNLIKFKNEKYEVLHLGRISPMPWYLLDGNHLESNFVEKAQGVMVTKFRMSQQCSFVAKVATGVLGCLRGVLPVG